MDLFITGDKLGLLCHGRAIVFNKMVITWRYVIKDDVDEAIMKNSANEEDEHNDYCISPN